MSNIKSSTGTDILVRRKPRLTTLILPAYAAIGWKRSSFQHSIAIQTLRANNLVGGVQMTIDVDFTVTGQISDISQRLTVFSAAFA